MKRKKCDSSGAEDLSQLTVTLLYVITLPKLEPLRLNFVCSLTVHNCARSLRHKTI
jgi:hypothetical protein